MSVTGSCASIKPLSTVIGCLSVDVPDDVNREGPEIDHGGDLLQREICLQFQTKLQLTDYLRDKNNEERSRFDSFIRINSRRLRCSYEIPSVETYSFLERLYKALKPGLRAQKKKDVCKDVTFTKEESKALKTLRNWITCSDFSVQVFPKAPSVLWLDLECMPCKSGKAGEKKHIISKEIIKIVVDEVFEYTKDIKKCDQLYVTRGKTCGMHLFFPKIVLNSDDDLQEVWNLVNKRLANTNQNRATVDTGCSALPLPLARNHSGLTRVQIVWNSNDGKTFNVKSYKLNNLSVKDLARVTNFHHLVADAMNDTKRCSSPTASLHSDTTLSSTDSRKSAEKNVNVAFASENTSAPVPENIDGTVEEKSSNCNIDVSTEAVKVAVIKSGEDSMELQCYKEMIDECYDLKLHEKEITKIDLSNSDDERSSAVSCSSKELKQTDICSMFAKVNTKRKKTCGSEYHTNNSTGETSVKRRRLNEDVIESIKDEPKEIEVAVSTTSRPSDGVYHSTSKSEDCDKASSFLHKGYTPSDDSFQVRDSSLLTSTSEEGLESVHSRNEQKDRYPAAPTTRDTGSVLSPVSHREQKPYAATFSMPAEISFDPICGLYVANESVPDDARLPVLVFSRDPDEENKTPHTREVFENNMRLHLDDRQTQGHETDIQLILSSFNTELQFYNSMMNNSTPADGSESTGLRVKSGGSLNAGRENCPTALFAENVPRVLYTDDFVSETEWIKVLIRYFDEYLNNAPFLYVMLHVLIFDDEVKKALCEEGRASLQRTVERCLSRFKEEALRYRKKKTGENTVKEEPYVLKHGYEEKCVIVIGLIAVCSRAYNIVTPVFTDLAKTCRLLLSNDRQTLDSLNSSSMSTASTYDPVTYGPAAEEEFDFDESVSKPAPANENPELDCAGSTTGTSECNRKTLASIGNHHSVIASILRWNYSALAEQTRWCLFFYYYHVHTDGLSRIMNEVVHSGLMVTAVLQAYFEIRSAKAPVDVNLLCSQIYVINHELYSDQSKLKSDGEQNLMPPPTSSRQRGSKQPQKNKNKRGADFKKLQSNTLPDRLRDKYDEDEDSSLSGNYYKFQFGEIMSMIVHRYLRPVCFDDSTVVYSETGYEQNLNEFATYYAKDKQAKRMLNDLCGRFTMKYTMPHGELLLYNTDVMGTVHRRSSCTNNLVLNIFENMYGGCMTFLTRHINNYLKLFNRFNGDAYLLAVECRHAMNELVRSVDLSYINLLLRQPIVPPVLEADISVRNMFMSHNDILQGAFVCLNAMDYVRAINMFTSHSKFTQENCSVVECFLNRLITNRDLHYNAKDEDACTRFRTVYLFFLLYVFEVLYKIRHAYHRDRTYHVSIERLSWDVDVRLLLKLFFGQQEFKMPRGLSPDILKQLHIFDYLYDRSEFTEEGTEVRAAVTSSRRINTHPVVSTNPPDKMSRMIELFGQKGIALIKSYGPMVARIDGTEQRSSGFATADTINGKGQYNDRNEDILSGDEEEGRTSYSDRDKAFQQMTQAQLEKELYSSSSWYENCHVRMRAVRCDNREVRKSERNTGDLALCMDATSMETFLRAQLRVTIDNGRLNHIKTAVRQQKDFAFCTDMPSRVKVMALVLATHSVKRFTSDVATDFICREYRLERSGSVKRLRIPEENIVCDDTNDGEDTDTGRPDLLWEKTWCTLLDKRKNLLFYCRSLADSYFPDSYFVGLQPEKTYDALYSYMLKKPKYSTLHALKDAVWAKDMCAALNYLLVVNAYDPELVEFCLRMFLGFEWPGQWAKRIFVWKSNSNAGKSFLFEHVIKKAFGQSTCINDPKGGKDNAPEKSEYYKNFVLMINEFSSASAAELKKLCSTSSYKFRMNFGNQPIQAFVCGKMVFNCNTLPLTTDHATIQRVALVPLPFWFQKRQSVVESMLNWTRGHSQSNVYEKSFKQYISHILTDSERRFFIENSSTKNEDDLFNSPNERSLDRLSELKDQNAKASMFLVQNKTSQVYMLSNLQTDRIVSGIVMITRYFCRFRFFNNIKEPVDYAALPTASTAAAQEWQRISQPYFEWKERYRVKRDTSVLTKASTIYTSLNHFAKSYPRSVSFFDLRQFFEWDFAEQKIQNFSRKEDEYNVSIDPLQD